MNKARAQSMYASDQSTMCMDIFSTDETEKYSRNDDFYEQVREMFLQQSAHYLHSNIN